MRAMRTHEALVAHSGPALVILLLGVFRTAQFGLLGVDEFDGEGSQHGR